MFSITLTLLATAVFRCVAESPQIYFSGGNDLAQYISRPELRNPLLNITRLEPGALTPGYWFMAPYANLDARYVGPEFIPYQAGPTIYDNSGELIWSGAKMVENRNTYDLRLVMLENGPALSFLIDGDRRITDTSGAGGYVMDTSYEISHKVYVTKSEKGFQSVGFNMHEFNIIGNSSLSIWEKKISTDLSDLKNDGVNLTALGLRNKMGVVLMNGFREIDINTKKITFDWWPLEHGVSLSESKCILPTDWSSDSWDFAHMNAVDKNKDGDYLLSMRHTSALYKISHVDGSVLWRLGGKSSDFEQDFNFSSQHDAKFVSQNESVTIISLFDNGSDDKGRQNATALASSLKVIALYEHETPMRATLLKEVVRPDGKLTRKRGQAQLLPNGGSFIGWSDRGYISEHAPDGRPVMEARFTGPRFVNYRAYKFNYVGLPAEPPTLKTLAFGSGALESLSSLLAVSWNGATEVAKWKFYGSNDVSKGFKTVGYMDRSGFETTYIDNAFWAFSYAEAFHANGSVLGKSEIEEIILPNGHQRNITEVGLLISRKQNERQSAYTISTIVFVGLLVSAGLTALLITRAKRWQLCFRRQAYHQVRDDEKFADAGELSELKDDDESDNESENGSEAEGLTRKT